MDFLDRFNEVDRERLLAAATTVRLARGEFLIRRGDRGGDLFRVDQGEMEVIDTRSQPAVVLDVMGAGTVVGEMAFLDENLRSADVRAADIAVCQRWDRSRLLRVLEEEPGLGVSFYRVLAQITVERARSLTQHAVVGAVPGLQPGHAGGDDAEGHAIADALRARFLEIEPLLRRDIALARRELLASLHTFAASLSDALGRMSEEDAVATGMRIARDLHPYVMRSRLGEMALSRAGGHCGDAATLAHLLDGQPGGDGPLGEIIDEWLLSLPTARAFRERRAHASQLVMEALPAEPPLRAMVVNAVEGKLVADLTNLLGGVRGELLVIGGTRENLAAVDAAVPRRHRDLKLRLVQDDLAAICAGRGRIRYQPQHILVLDALLEYLPERVAATLLRWAAGQLAPSGHLIVTALTSAPDDPVFRHLLGWPLVRRGKSALLRLLSSAGFDEARVWDAGAAGLVGTACLSSPPPAPPPASAPALDERGRTA